MQSLKDIKHQWGFHEWDTRVLENVVVPANNECGITTDTKYLCNYCGKRFWLYGETDPASLH